MIDAIFEGLKLTFIPRRITISIDTTDAPQVNPDQEFISNDFPSEMAIADLKGYIENETNIPSASQRLSYNGQELQDGSKTLQQCNIAEDSMLGMHVRNPQAASMGSSRPVQAQARRPAQAGSGQGARGPGQVDPEHIRLQALGDPAILQSIRQTQPELADAVQNPARFRQIWDGQVRMQQEIAAERQRKMNQLTADPFNVDAQREIEEMIRQEQVAENLQNAMEHNPEGEHPWAIVSIAG